LHLLGQLAHPAAISVQASALISSLLPKKHKKGKEKKENTSANCNLVVLRSF